MDRFDQAGSGCRGRGIVKASISKTDHLVAEVHNLIIDDDTDEDGVEYTDAKNPTSQSSSSQRTLSWNVEPYL